MTRNNIFYSRGSTYPADSGAPRNDFKNDLTGGYLQITRCLDNACEVLRARLARD